MTKTLHRLRPFFSLFRYLAFTLAGTGLVVAVLAFVLPETLVNPIAGNFLVATDPLVKSDVIYILGGDYLTRAPHAAALYHQGLATKIVVPRENMGPRPEDTVQQHFTDATLDILRRGNVPETALVDWRFEQGVRTTADEAAALAKYVDVFKPQRVIVVTSAFHTRRAGFVCRRSLWFTGTDILVAGVPNPAYAPENWWLSPQGRAAFNDEAKKLPYYWIRYLLGA